jgi:hypothetical protein
MAGNKGRKDSQK